MAEIFRAIGDEARAQTLLQEAEALKRRFHEVYWMEEEGCYAYGQDGYVAHGQDEDVALDRGKNANAHGRHEGDEG